MKPNVITGPRRMSGMLALGAAALLGLSAAPAARAGIIIPELSLVGGEGVPGSTVSVTVNLSDDLENLAASADVDIVFPADQLRFFPPVAQNCDIDPRLATSHVVGGQLDGDDVVILSIFPNPNVFPIVHLGNGPLASCAFRIQPGIPAGTADVRIENPGLFDDMGDPLDVNTMDGFVRILDDISPTPTNTPILSTPTRTGTATATGTNTPPTEVATPTNTPTGDGNTPTNTPTGDGNTPTNTPTGGTPTNTPTGGTPTNTPTGGTPTRTPQTGPTNTPFGFADDDSCSIVPAEQGSSGGMLALLLAPAILIWARRRRF